MDVTGTLELGFEIILLHVCSTFYFLWIQLVSDYGIHILKGSLCHIKFSEKGPITLRTVVDPAPGEHLWLHVLDLPAGIFFLIDNR